MRGRRSGRKSRSRRRQFRAACLRGACAVRPRQPRTRAASGPALGTLRPLCEVLADGPALIAGTRKRGPELGECRKAFARAAAGRREARRPASWAGHLRRSGDGSAREAGHRVRRFRTSACRRSAPLIFSGSGNRQGAPAPFDRAGGALASSFRGREARARIHNNGTGG